MWERFRGFKNPLPRTKVRGFHHEGAEKFWTGIERQGLKPNLFSLFTARLKSCPDTKQIFPQAYFHLYQV
jgi:hypothetical protein